MASEESLSSYQKRVSEADRWVIGMKGPKPKHNEISYAVASLMITMIISMIALALANVPSERSENIVLGLSISAAAVTFLWNRVMTNAWYKAWGKRMQETAPRD
ncbi:hypothetical protein [Pseudomonas brassicacearum]|uniref:hypothetical protein n=1 Tax=Pseudomonas brassicacearum TaxID=930166 RepID=UPI001DFA68C5|nr:hypothetical protein [Pseudomonas brassicacearum]CAH0125241.1 hypothetical protein SRABI06_00052 [Pseudomonas brassicacearum]